MRIGIDIHMVAASRVRAGLYFHWRNLVRELRRTAAVRLFAPDAAGRVPPLDAAAVAGLSAAFDGTPVTAVRPWRRAYRVFPRLSACNRVDVFIHNLSGWFPAARGPANMFLVPDVIPIAFDYGDPSYARDCRAFYERAVRDGDLILAFSEHGKRDLLARVGGDPSRIRVCPLAADPSFAPPADPAAQATALGGMGLAGTRYVLCVSTIEKRKNHALLVRAFADAVRRNPALPHKLVFAGAKWVGHEPVFELAGRLLGDRFVYLGYAENLPALYAGADAFVFPSLYEGFGLPPLEAMACGTATLAADATCLPEVVGGGGLLFDPHDPADLAGKLGRVLADPAHRAELAAKGLARAAGFSWRRTAELYLDACRDARAAAGRRVVA